MSETQESLLSHWKQAKAKLNNCDCGGAVTMLYEPGCTRVCCIRFGTMLAVPDWSPDEAVRRWNAGERDRECQVQQD